MSQELEFLDHNCNVSTREEIDTIKYMYDKEVKRLQIINDKIIAAIAFLAVDFGLFAFSSKSLLGTTLGRILSVFLVFAVPIIIFCFVAFFAFSTKINEEKQDFSVRHLISRIKNKRKNAKKQESLKYDYESMKKYSGYLHDMNNRKEKILLWIFSVLALILAVECILEFLRIITPVFA